MELFSAIGPEGGWTEDELQAFQQAGWISASLGNTILRAETAAIAAIGDCSFRAVLALIFTALALLRRSAPGGILSPNGCLQSSISSRSISSR